ncbi:YwdI family protein [Oceanobacillus sp. CFH 90083]|uniref:YwdI family protein n=1 Tax=Oceanobacillus sp. CFH 90083 TaxID=2592336 RepID=UPI00128BBA66|nr:YwdI family protein [Oceanobacillus sp. CFH 90083]
MAVSNEIIINKMIRELEEAKRKAHQQEQVKKHMENIHLLSELFISASPDINTTFANQVQGNIEDTEERISEAEMKAMLGKQTSVKVINPGQKKLNDEDANGDSIFEF